MIGECFERSTNYVRGAGFFASTFFDLGSRSLQHFAVQGRARIVVSPRLGPKDLELFQSIIDGHPAPKSQGARLVAEMIATGRLDLRFATKADGVGMYHEKVGAFFDSDGDYVAFSGSNNESASALTANYEFFQVFRSWVDSEQAHALDIIGHCDHVWGGFDDDLIITELRRARGILECVPNLPELFDQAPPGDEGGDSVGVPPPEAGSVNTDVTTSVPSIPSELSLKPHQTDALAEWFRRGFRGVLAMATGSGKTVTALAGATMLSGQSKRLLVLVLCPYTHLVDQWAREAQRFGFLAVKCYGSRKTWSKDAVRQVGLVSRTTDRTGMLICTNATFIESEMQEVLQAAKAPILLIADEAHALGSAENIAALEANQHAFTYSLGLSATFERWNDLEGTERLSKILGDVVFEYDLARALNAGVLVPYRYYVHLVPLTLDEAELYSTVMDEIAKAMEAGERPYQSRNLSSLLAARARATASVRGKLERLRVLLTEQRRSAGRISHTLVYCGDGRVETDTDDGSAEQRQIDAVLDLMTFDLGIRASKYVAETRLDDRLLLQKELASGEKDAIAAIRCLDEGVDIPSVSTAYVLASSRNPRQSIQRRGRVLRRDAESGKLTATIHDFLIEPPRGGDRRVWDAERELLRQELKRVVEFSELSRNRGDVLQTIRPLREHYELMAF